MYRFLAFIDEYALRVASGSCSIEAILDLRDTERDFDSDFSVILHTSLGHLDMICKSLAVAGSNLNNVAVVVDCSGTKLDRHVVHTLFTCPWIGFLRTDFCGLTSVNIRSPRWASISPAPAPASAPVPSSSSSSSTSLFEVSMRYNYFLAGMWKQTSVVASQNDSFDLIALFDLLLLYFRRSLSEEGMRLKNPVLSGALDFSKLNSWYQFYSNVFQHVNLRKVDISHCARNEVEMVALSAGSLCALQQRKASPSHIRMLPFECLDMQGLAPVNTNSNPKLDILEMRLRCELCASENGGEEYKSWHFSFE